MINELAVVNVRSAVFISVGLNPGGGPAGLGGFLMICLTVSTKIGWGPSLSGENITFDSFVIGD